MVAITGVSCSVLATRHVDSTCMSIFFAKGSRAASHMRIPEGFLACIIQKAGVG